MLSWRPRPRGARMAARRRRSPGLALPTFTPAALSLPRSHRAGKAKPAKAPPEPPAPRTRTRTPGANTRAQLASRAGSGRSGLGQRVTPLNDRDDRYGTRTYPPNTGNVRQRGTGATSHLPTRSQLAVRDTVRNAQGHADTKPHPKSGEGARSNVKARGRVPRPASPMPSRGTPTRRPTRAERHPELYGAAQHPSSPRIERERDAAPSHPFFRERSRHIGRPPQ